MRWTGRRAISSMKSHTSAIKQQKCPISPDSQTDCWFRQPGVQPLRESGYYVSEGRPLIHIVHVALKFCAARFLRSKSSAEIWNKFHKLWKLQYFVPHDHFIVDQGTNYSSKELRGNRKVADMKPHEAPLENFGTIGTI